MKIYNELYKKQLKQKRKKILKNILIWLVKITLILFLSVSTVYLFGKEVKMSGNSMYPTLENGDTVLINKFSNLIFKPKVGDLLVFRPNGNPLANIEIKRVVALPGDKVKISDGYLFVNSQKIDSNFNKIQDAGIAEKEITLSAGDYFVLSDNRNIMQDSRNVSFGMVRRSYCIGKAWFIISPSGRRGIIR